MAKNLKRAASLLLAIFMVLSSVVFAFAKDVSALPWGNSNTITENPSNVTVTEGEDAVFTIKTDGEIKSVQWQVLKYLWWENLSTKKYGSSDTLKFAAALSDNGMTVRAYVTFKNGAKKYSGTAKLTVVKKTEAPVVEEPVAEEPVVEDPIVEDTEEPEEIPVEETEEVVVEEPVEETEEVIEEEPAYPARNLDAADGDTAVLVDVPEGALPKDVSLATTKVDTEEYASKVADFTGEENVNVALAVDISFTDDDDTEYEPNGDVTVTIADEALKGIENPLVYHIADDGTVNLVEGVVVNEDGSLTFAAGQFSVYVVVDEGESGDEARATVSFYGLNDALVTTYYVKNSDELPPTEGEKDPTVSYLDDIVTDPGVGGQIPAGQIFLGWYIGENKYTSTDITPLTIDGVRSYLAGLSIEEGDVVNVWAVIFKVFTVSYLDEQNISLGTDEIKILTSELSAPYTVSKNYIPTDPRKNFEGWDTSDTSKISNAQYQGESVEKPYKLGTTMTISGDIVFTVEAPQGNWLVFDENGKGATYNAPQFIKSEDVTKEPTLQMSRLGYTFGGWYTDQACTDGNEFTFGGKITERTTIYAKWTIVTSANYVVIIWNQNVNDAKDAADSAKTYDFAESWTLSGTVDSTITLNRNGNTVSAGGNSYTAKTGFAYRTMDTGKKVSAQGNTVVNVYYDRNLVTLTFQVYGYTYTQSTSTSNGYYYIPDGNGGYTREYLYRNNGRWWRDRNYNWGWQYTNEYVGDVYTRSNNESWNTRETMTGLYGSSITENGYTWPTDLWWYANGGNNGNTSGTRTTFLDAFLPPNGGDSMTFYGNDNSGNRAVHFLKEDPDHEGTFIEDISVSTGTGNFNISDKYNGYKAVSYSTNNTSWTDLGDKNPSTGYYASIGTYTNLYIRYSPLKYNISFMDGIYVDGNGNKLDDYEPLGQLREVENVVYGSNTSAYNKSGSTYYEPTTSYNGFVFEGWYVDDNCTMPYTFTTMPEGITVYAKWRQVQYRVFLHPNATLPDGTNDPSLDWGDEGRVDEDGNPVKQAMNFRIDYLGVLSVPTGLRDEYEFIGWFVDEAATIPYDTATKLTENSVTADYNKNDPANYTDVMNKFGEIEGSGWNSDLIGWDHDNDESTPSIDRYWITKKLDLYGKWSAVLTGAEGIGVTYLADPGSNAPTDTKKYKDNVDAIAGTASTAPNNQRFLYWVVQKYTGTGEYDGYADTSTIVYPGAPFTVMKSLAKETDLSEDDADYEEDVVYKAYTMQLRAVYGNAEASADTHITWYANGGEYIGTATSGTKLYVGDVTLTQKGLKINEAVTIPGAADFTRTGYKFLGWAKATEPTDAFNPENGTVDETKYSENPEVVLWLKANSDGTYDEMNGETVKNAGVTQVAADEATPYHALYAVWEYVGVFYVFHSSDGTVDLVDMAAMTEETYDLTAVMKGDYLYGGYFKGYFNVTDEQAIAVAGKGTAATEYKYTGEALYQKIEGKAVKYWNKTGDKGAYTKDGSKLVPVPETVYYLREVSPDFLGLKVQVVYSWNNGNSIDDLYLITTVDNNIYDKVGFKVTTTDKQADLYATFSIQSRDNSNVTKITAADINGIGGYVGAYDGTAELITGADANSEFTVLPYYVTLDGFRVDDTRDPRTFNIGDKTFGKGDASMKEIKE